MKYQITSDNIDLSPSMEELTKGKFERIENRIKSFPEEQTHTRVVLNSAPDGMFTVKAKLNVNGKEYFSDETDFSLEGALIKTVEEIVQMIERDKSIMERKRNKQMGEVEEFEEVEGEQ